MKRDGTKNDYSVRNIIIRGSASCKINGFIMNKGNENFKENRFIYVIQMYMHSKHISNCLVKILSELLWVPPIFATFSFTYPPPISSIVTLCCFKKQTVAPKAFKSEKKLVFIAYLENISRKSEKKLYGDTVEIEWLWPRPSVSDDDYVPEDTANDFSI